MIATNDEGKTVELDFHASGGYYEVRVDGEVKFKTCPLSNNFATTDVKRKFWQWVDRLQCRTVKQ